MREASTRPAWIERQARLKAVCKRVCEKRKMKYFREKTSDTPPIGMSVELQQKAAPRGEKS